MRNVPNEIPTFLAHRQISSAEFNAVAINLDADRGNVAVVVVPTALPYSLVRHYPSGNRADRASATQTGFVNGPNNPLGRDGISPDIASQIETSFGPTTGRIAWEYKAPFLESNNNPATSPANLLWDADENTPYWTAVRNTAIPSNAMDVSILVFERDGVDEVWRLRATQEKRITDTAPPPNAVQPFIYEARNIGSRTDTDLDQSTFVVSLLWKKLPQPTLDYLATKFHAESTSRSTGSRY